jgi:hypothetical protein
MAIVAIGVTPATLTSPMAARATLLRLSASGSCREAGAHHKTPVAGVRLPMVAMSLIASPASYPARRKVPTVCADCPSRESQPLSDSEIGAYFFFFFLFAGCGTLPVTLLIA